MRCELADLAAAAARQFPRRRVRVGANRRGRMALAGAVLFAILVAIAVSFAVGLPHRQADAQLAADAATAKGLEMRRVKAELRRSIDRMAEQRVILFADYDEGMMRISPEIWDRLPIGQKRTLIHTFAMAVSPDAEPRSAKVLSDRSGECFAEYSVWSGLEIHR